MGRWKESDTREMKRGRANSKMIDGTDKGRSVYAGLTFIKVAIDFPDAKWSLMLAEATYSALCG